MQTVSQDYIDIWEGQHRVEVRVKIDRDDYPEGYWILQDNNRDPILTSSSANIEVAPFPSADLQEGQLFSVTITGGLFATQSFTIGSCVSREIEVRFLLGEAVIPRMAKIQPEVRLVNDNGDVSEWIPKGTFWLDTRELDRTTGIMTIRGYDAMLKGESLYIVPGEDVGEWPKTMADVADEIADMMGLTIDARTTLNQTYEMQLPTDYTMRELLGYIAVANCGNWVITDEGKLRLIRVNDTVDSVDLGLAAKTYHISEPYQAFSKVELDLSEELYVEAGDDTGRTLEVALPVVTTEDGEDIAEDILDALDGFIYTPLTADGAILDPAYEIGDHVTVGTATVGTTTGILATQTMRLDSLCASDITSPGDEELDHEYPYESVSRRAINRRVSEVNAKAVIAADHISWIVESGTSASDFTMTDRAISQATSTLSLTAVSSEGVTVGTVDSTTGGGVVRFAPDGDGWYKSTNVGTNTTVAYAKINFNFESDTVVYLDCINLGEINKDFGIVSEVDVELLKSIEVDSTGVLYSFAEEVSEDPVELHFTVPAGNHFITVKFRKDGSGSGAGDYFRFHAHSGPLPESTLLLKAGNATLSSASIVIRGTVTFEDLSSSGRTVINGDNIVSGTISADRIDVDDLHVEKVYYGEYKILESEVTTSSGSVTDYAVKIGIDNYNYRDISRVILCGGTINFAPTTTDNWTLTIDPVTRGILPDTNSTKWRLGSNLRFFSRLYLGEDGDSQSTGYFNCQNGHLFWNGVQLA